jgi:flagellar basal-body rod protein FlgG
VSVTVSDDGTITFGTDAESADVTARLGIYGFRNEAGLLAVGNENYAESASSGERLTEGLGAVTQGGLEGSNVELATEMTRLIRAQRAFSLAGRALTTADEMEGIANALRR